MIEAQGISKKLGKFHLKNISFTLPEGYICGLVGRNGAGKTTLLRLLLGLYRAEEGRLTIDGMNYLADEKRIHDEIGMVEVEELFASYLTLMQNANRFGQYYSKYDAARMKNYLERFHLNPQKKFGKLSKGEKLKCQFAFALSHDPKILILDEPTGNFDPEFREQFWEELMIFMEDGTRNVILATNLTEELDRRADYLVYLEEGTLIYEGDMERFRETYRKEKDGIVPRIEDVMINRISHLK